MANTERLTDVSLTAALEATPGPLIADFYADWCGPCGVLGPFVERIAREHPEIRVIKVDIDAEPGLSASHDVFSIPTLIRFDDGEETLRVTGALPYERLLEALGVVAAADRIAA